ncbi:PH and SEC7 domain-containing protein 2-like isoform X1 [Arapaima gigas]
MPNHIDFYSTTFECSIEEKQLKANGTEVAQKEKERAEEKQDDLSFTSVCVMESEPSQGTRCGSLGSLDDLSAAGKTDRALGCETALALLIQQGVQQVQLQQQHNPSKEQEVLKVGQCTGLGVQGGYGAYSGSPLPSSVTSSQSENNLSRSRPPALTNGFHAASEELLGTTCNLPNSSR